MTARSVAVVGGGINGVMTAWHLAQHGHRVDLFERDTLMGATSQSSTKLLHGGLRYLENGEFRLVRESLRERTWWVKHAPSLARPIKLFLPLYRDNGRPRWMIGAALFAYDFLAGSHTFGRHHWHNAAEVLRQFPTLRSERLIGAYSFFDAQMDDYALGMWSVARARAEGVVVHEHTAVDRVTPEGELYLNTERAAQYDGIVNVAGPWAETLLRASGITPEYALDLVRGSHIVLDGVPSAGLLVQVPGERRICFVLPYRGQTLVGTTEVRHELGEPIICSVAERDYLIAVYNAYFSDTRTTADICATFAGVRPLIHSAADPSRATREYAIERHGRLLTVFGGKWTTARALAERVAEEVEKLEG